jgi:hypothetical protein
MGDFSLLAHRIGRVGLRERCEQHPTSVQSAARVSNTEFPFVSLRHCPVLFTACVAIGFGRTPVSPFYLLASFSVIQSAM